MNNSQTSCGHSCYTEQDLLKIQKHSTPKHIAIIMDGNRRWAHMHQLPIQMGHAKGAEQLKQIVEAAMELNLETLTVYAFSTENNKRAPNEVYLLFALFKKYLLQERKEMQKNGIKLETIGDFSSFPEDLQEIILTSKKMTENENKLKLVLAVNYGARDEIRRAVQRIVQDTEVGKIKSQEITENLIESYLDTAEFTDPDLLIRTSGELRLSNFLLWQISYTEIYVSQEPWPDFNPQSLLKAILNYQKRKIRRGL